MGTSSHRTSLMKRRDPPKDRWTKQARTGKARPLGRIIGWALLAVTGTSPSPVAQELNRQSAAPAPQEETPLDAGTTNAPALDPRFGFDLGRQSYLRRPPRPHYFRAYSDTQVLYNSNVLLADGDFIQEGEDGQFLQSFGLNFTPPLVYPVTSTFYLRHDLSLYDKFDQYDFHTDVGGLRLSAPVHDWFTVYGGFSASLSYFQDGGDDFYKYFDTQVGLSREQLLTQRTVLLYGYQLDWRPSSPSELTRVDNSVFAGLSIGLVDKLTAQVLYRLRFRAYYEDNRTDTDQLGALNLVYAFNDYIGARLSASYGRNDSSVADKAYQVFTGGIGLNLQIKF